ncbi:MAG: response regulator transcription factor [Termitinemataceae bacterium]|nr:MAG: response regulator transcription factor [Termitinemataceae bacterium]
MRKIIVSFEDKKEINLLVDELKKLHDYKIDFCNNTGYSIVNLSETVKPAVMILNYSNKSMSTINICRAIKLRSPSTQIVIIMEDANADAIVNAIKNGACALVLKENLISDVCPSIRSIETGSVFMSMEIMRESVNLLCNTIKSDVHNGIQNNNGGSKKQFVLNETEFNISSYIGNGFSNKEIADFMRLNEATVRNYISKILRKCNLNHRTQIALYAINNYFASKEYVLKTEKQKSLEDNYEQNFIQHKFAFDFRHQKKAP